MPLNVAIVGLGIMGRRMLEHMRLHEAFTPRSMWDPDPAACAAALALAPEVRVATSAEDAMADAELVYLACPPVPRKAYAVKAAQAGIAVFLEKPLGVDLGDSARLVDALHSSGVPAAVNFTQAAGRALRDVSSVARSGAMGDLVGAEIIVTYPVWPRAWQVSADWLRFRAEGGMTREVISHFLFFTERLLGPLTVVWARPDYPSDPALCETGLLARLESAAGQPISVLASVGGAQPDRQELTIKGSRTSRRIAEFFIDATSDGGPFEEVAARPADPRSESLRAQLDDLRLCVEGKPNRLATPQEALRVQKLVETMLQGQG